MAHGSSSESGRPRDVVAIFHTSFHPTQGNVVDWCLTAPGWEDLQTDSPSLEFSALPSGLHQVDEDTIYFTSSIKSSPKLLHAASVFLRRRTPNPIYRGFLLGSLGVLVIPSYADGTAAASKGVQKPRPWRHVEALKQLAARCYSRPGSDPSALPELIDIGGSDSKEWYAPARTFLAEHSALSTTLHDYLSRDWEVERGTPESGQLDDLRTELALSKDLGNPVLQLPTWLTLLGPSSITLFKHLLARKRVMVYTNPPVGPSCGMCFAVVEMVRTIQSTQHGISKENVTVPPRHQKPVRVLGMLTLHDLVNGTKRGIIEDKEDEGRGWVACTTDALFLERPQYYDMLIDLTAVSASSSLSSTSATSGLYHPGVLNGKNPLNLVSNRPRPTLYVSKASSGSGSRLIYKLSQTRWAWSDARLWNEVDRILQSGETYHNGEPVTTLQSTSSSGSSSVSSTNGKAKKRKSKSKSRERRAASERETESENLESTQLERIPTSIPTSLVDAWKVYEDVCLVCAGVWMGSLSARAGGGAEASTAGVQPHICCVLPPPTASWTIPSGSGIKLGGEDDALFGDASGKAKTNEGEPLTSRSCGHSKTQPELSTTLDLLYALNRYAAWQIGALHAYVRSIVEGGQADWKEGEPVKLTLTPRDLVLLDLNPLSTGDVKYLEVLVKEYAGHVVVRVEVTPEEAENLLQLQEGRGREENLKDMDVDFVVKRSWKDLVAVVLGIV